MSASTNPGPSASLKQRSWVSANLNAPNLVADLLLTSHACCPYCRKALTPNIPSAIAGAIQSVLEEPDAADVGGNIAADQKVNVSQ